MGLVGKIGEAITDLAVICWDNGIALANLVTPKLKAGQVVPEGAPGHHLKWPEYVPPKEGDSRSACPMLNAMVSANSTKTDASFSGHTGNTRDRWCV